MCVPDPSQGSPLDSGMKFKFSNCAFLPLMIVFGLMILPVYAVDPLDQRLEAETVLPVFLNNDTAVFVFKCLQSSDINIVLTFQEQATGASPRPPVGYSIFHGQGSQEKSIDISAWPDGDYKVTITDDQNPSSGSLIRAIRKQTIPAPSMPSEPIRVAGVTTLFVDDWYIAQQNGLAREVHPARLIPIEPSKIDSSYFRYYNEVKDFWFDKEGALYVNVYGSNNGPSVIDLWMKSTDLQTWQITDKPTAVKKDCTYTRLIKEKIGTLFSGTPTYRYYNPAQDGPVNLQQVNVINSGFSGCTLGDISVPPRCRVAVWQKPTGQYLVLTNPVTDPIIQDKWNFEDDEIGTWKDSNDNFGPQTMSMDGSTLRFYQTRAIPRNDPFRVYYDNVFFDRIMAVWSTTDGMNWDPTYLEIPTRQESSGLQHYGIYVFPEENNTLEMAFIRMYDSITQKTHTELACSRDGVQWNRLTGQSHFLPSGEFGSWNFGFCYPGSSRIRVEKDGRYYEPINGSDILHFMKLPIWTTTSRSHITVQYFLDRYDGRLAESIPSSEIWDWYGQSWQNIVDETLASSTEAGLMCYRKDGWVSLSSNAGMGQLTTKVLKAAEKLYLNARTEPSGFIKVEVLDAAGGDIAAYCSTNAATFTGDSVKAELSWSNGNVTKLPASPFKLRITIQNADLYSLYWSPENRVVYVRYDAAGGNDGSSWADAYTDLQQALKNSRPGDQIWVARGTYKPTQEIFDSSRYVSFDLKENIALYGGFTGSETALEQRDVQTNPTILSGDLYGDDGINFTNYSENSLHVLTADYVDRTAILDGFTIIGGNSNLGYPHNAGTGLIISDYGSPTLSNCVFVANYASSGGGAIWLKNSDSILTDCVFTDNRSGYYAGAFYAYEEFSGSLIGCTFMNNTAVNSGGAVRIRRSLPFIENCTFADNSSGESGGGIIVTDQGVSEILNCHFEHNTAVGRAGAIYVGEQASASIEGCVFSQNTGPYGGAVRLAAAGEVAVYDCTFTANTASSGGGLYNYGARKLAVTNSYFIDNQAIHYAGALLASQSGSTEIFNCVFAENAANYGGAIRFESGNPGFIRNCTFYGNAASTQYNAVALVSDSALQDITNCILQDGGDEIQNVSSALSVNYCNIEGGYSGNGSNNIDLPPLFENPTQGNYRLTANSPCVDAGDSSVITELIGWDLDRNYRIAGISVDMGAYEFGASAYIGICGDPEHPYPTGDLNYDCRVNLADFSLLAANWLVCTISVCDQ